jgi:hypothetical protein
VHTTTTAYRKASITQKNANEGNNLAFFRCFAILFVTLQQKSEEA